jgi:hypothetical protein
MSFHTEPGVLPDSAPNALVSNAIQPGRAAAECWLAVNPKEPNKAVCAVRQVPSPAQFAQSTVAMYYSLDAGSTWNASQQLSLTPPAPDQPFGANANPSVVWDNAGNAYLLTLAVTQNLSSLVGIAFYKSTDGGVTWAGPALVHRSRNGVLDDKSDILVDNSGGIFNGRIYAVCMEVGASVQNQIAFARSDDQGTTWFGTNPGKGSAPGSVVGATHPWPSVSLSPEGVIYIAYGFGTGFRVLKSTDGGDTFETCTDVGGLNIYPVVGATVYVGSAPESGDHFDKGTFRVNSFISVYAGSNGLVLCSWIDSSFAARIYYMRSLDFGVTWEGPASGAPLSFNSNQNTYHFSPQFSVTPKGVIVCNYYSYTPTAKNTGLIDVHGQVSFDQGKSFSGPYRINDTSWDTLIPMITLGTADDNTTVTFIGDYFGLAAGAIGGIWGEGFISAWTDGRTGGEEIFSARSFFGPLIVYDPEYFIPRYFYDPGDPVPSWARFIISTILAAFAFVLLGIDSIMLNEGIIPGLLPLSIGLSFGSAILFSLSLPLFNRASDLRASLGNDRRSISPNLDTHTAAVWRKLTGAGIVINIFGLILTILPVDTILRERSLYIALYSTIICAVLAGVFYLIVRQQRSSGR